MARGAALALRARLGARLRRRWAPDLAARDVQPEAVPTSGATERLLARLPEDALAALPERLGPDERASWDRAEGAQRRRLALALGVHLRLPEWLERTGLSAAEPPPEVHAMVRGPEHAGGAYELADLVASALEAAGAPLAAGQAALDFGCSSGRVVRVLAAAHPDVRWHGREPNAGAVAWAAEHLPGIDFARSGQEPPLDLGAGALDAAFAISIWSHYSERAALDWLEEMRRVLRPGGHLLLTFHGEHSLAFMLRAGLRDADWLGAARAGMYRRGHWFYDDFGPAGDHGVRSADWGVAFLTLGWLCAHATPAWRLALYRPGHALGNQDVAVLRRA